MQIAICMAVAMIVAAPVVGHLRAKIWAEKNGLVRKEIVRAEPIAMSFH